jgi:hypothetical protein
VWDLWEGANFRFKAYKEGEYLKYDKSTFDSPSEFLGGDEAKIEEVLAQCHKLNQFVAPENFKSYDDLQRQLDLVMGNSAQKQEHSQSKDLDDLQKLAETSKPKESAKKPKQESPAKEEKVSEPATSTGDDDDTLNYFKSLLNDD